jgi:hypothetical protein
MAISRLLNSPSKKGFARLLVHAIRQAGETGAIWYDAEQFRLIAEGDSSKSATWQPSIGNTVPCLGGNERKRYVATSAFGF